MPGHFFQSNTVLPAGESSCAMQVMPERVRAKLSVMLAAIYYKCIWLDVLQCCLSDPRLWWMMDSLICWSFASLALSLGAVSDGWKAAQWSVLILMLYCVLMEVGAIYPSGEYAIVFGDNEGPAWMSFAWMGPLYFLSQVDACLLTEDVLIQSCIVCYKP
jgi:hypothetical protein